MTRLATEAYADSAGGGGGVKPSVRVKRAGVAQAIPSGASSTAVQWDTAVHEQGGDLWNISQPTRLVAPEDGVYSITGCIGFAANANAATSAAILHSTGITLAREWIPASSGEQAEMNIATQFKMVAGEYVEITTSQNSGSNLNLAVANFVHGSMTKISD